MHTKLLQMAADLARREEPFVLALVVNRLPASSSQPGDMALITASGDFHGWLGGSCTQPTVVREARRALRDGKPRLLSLSPDAGSAAGAAEPAAASRAGRRPGVTFFPMTCQSGGSVEIYLEPILPAARLVVFGVSPIARALVKLGKAMDYALVAVDAAAEPAIFPGADEIFTDLAAPELAAAAARGPCFAVVATMGELDEEAIRAALALGPAYLGIVASSRRFAQMRQVLLAQGVMEAALESIRSPAGVDIGARTPEEIALSVLAEIVERRHLAGAAAGKPESAESDAPDQGPARAVDPVCGMSVEIAGARHRAELAGRAYYFCCGGCRERFLADPERFLAASSTQPRAGAA
jgi:xanthine dehydrogenase accessory factor